MSERCRSGCACFTIVRDEPIFLPLWHKHYARHFQPKDIFLLHHVASDDEVPADAFADAIALFDPANVTTLVYADFDPCWLREVVTSKLGSLLEAYEAVVFAEVDEMLVCTAEDLREFVSRFLASPISTVRCVGRELHHDFSSELSLGPRHL